uniref:Putative secreted peptide n=1 Tax=Anopheles braziliensis TaxID=58242 RepID=A0A2M3ZVX9_9DIPT
MGAGLLLFLSCPLSPRECVCACVCAHNTSQKGLFFPLSIACARVELLVSAFVRVSASLTIFCFYYYYASSTLPLPSRFFSLASS